MEYMKLARKIAEIEQECVDQNKNGQVVIHINKFGIQRITTSLDEKWSDKEKVKTN